MGGVQAKQEAAEADERLVEVKGQVAAKEAELQQLRREAAAEQEAMRREVQSIRAALQARILTCRSLFSTVTVPLHPHHPCFPSSSKDDRNSSGFETHWLCFETHWHFCCIIWLIPRCLCMGQLLQVAHQGSATTWCGAQRADAQQEELLAASSGSQAAAEALRTEAAGAQALCRQLEREVSRAHAGEQAAAAALAEARQELAQTQVQEVSTQPSPSSFG